MNEDSSGLGAEQIAALDAQAELERLLGDTRFHITDRNRAFLRYIADESFSGRSKGVKAYSVAIDVFGRPCNFDPNTDPIVRIEAARLRASLDQYYDAHGRAEQVRIRLPRGNYITEFSRISSDDSARPNDGAELSQEAPPTGSADTQPEKTAAASIRWPVFAGAAATLLIGGAGLGVLAQTVLLPATSDAQALIEKPLVAVSMTARDPDDRQYAESIEDGLMIALSRFGTLRLTNDLASGNKRPMATRSIDSEENPDSSQYEIKLKYNFEANSRSVLWRVVETSSGETLGSGEEMSKDAARTPAYDDTALISSLATRFASSAGILNGFELQKDYPAGAEGNICVLRAEHAINLHDIAELVGARSCLERTLAMDGRDVDAKAVLARVLVLEDEMNGVPANTSRALELSGQAIVAAPMADRSLAARMVAQYANGQRDAAFATGRTAVALNPLNSDTAAALALRLYISGAEAEGLAMARDLTADPDVRSRDADLVLALDAYCHGERQVALDRLDTIVNNDSLSYAVRIAALAGMGKRTEALLTLNATRQVLPEFPELMAKIMKARQFDPALARMLEHDIKIAANG